MVSRRPLLVVTSIAFSVVVACGDPTGSYSPGLTLVSGDGQTGTAGQSLQAPLVVRLADASGRPLRGDIGWEVLTGGGYTMPVTSQTDAHGLATTTWALGVEGLQQEVRAKVTSVGPDSQANALPPVTFTATAMGTATSLLTIAGDSQVAVIDDTLPAPLRVRAVTQTGAPVAGVYVQWSTTGGGVLLPHLPVTDTNGEVTATWVLGPTIGRQAATATAWFGSSVPPFIATANAAANTLTWTGEQLPGIPSCPTVTWSGIWAESSTNAFAVGSCGTIVHFAGSRWDVENSGTTRDLYDVWGRSSTDLYAVGDSGAIVHYDGVSWSPVAGFSSTAKLKAIWGSASGDLFVGSSTALSNGFGRLGSGSIWHDEGGGWTRQSGTVCAISGIWGTTSSNVFAISDVRAWSVFAPDCDQVQHYDGTTWTSFGGVGWGGVSGYGSDVYAAGLALDRASCTRGGCGWYSVIDHYDGTSWQVLLTTYGERFGGVWVGPDGDVVVVGGNGLILHADGPHWRRESSGTNAPIIAITGSEATSLWAITAGGLVLHGTRPSAAAAHTRRKS